MYEIIDKLRLGRRIAIGIVAKTFKHLILILNLFIGLIITGTSRRRDLVGR